MAPATMPENWKIIIQNVKDESHVGELHRDHVRAIIREGILILGPELTILCDVWPGTASTSYCPSKFYEVGDPPCSRS